MALFYADSSALVKLVVSEPETPALSGFLDGADLVSSELALAEIPRALRRAAARDPRLDLDRMLDTAAELLDSVALAPVDRALLVAAGAITEPWLRALDALHIMTAAGCSPVDGFLSYDTRQAAAARVAGLRTVAPGSAQPTA